MSGTYVESSLTEERENLASRLNLSVPVSYPSISQPINTNPSHSPQSQNSSNSFYASPSRTSGTATIQPPEQVANITEGPFSSAPPSGTIFSANQPERSYLQPPTWNNPRPETSQLRNSYENPPQYRETIQTNRNLLHSTRLHLGELGYGNLDRRIASDIFRILRSVVRSYDEGNLPHSVLARIELPGMWDHTRTLHNRWLHEPGAQYTNNTQINPSTANTHPGEPIPPTTQIVMINTPPDFSQSQQVFHSTPLETSFNANSAAATLQSITRAPPPTTASAQETAYNPELAPRSTFPTWDHERQEPTTVENAAQEAVVQPQGEPTPIPSQIFSPRPATIINQPIRLTETNINNRPATTAPPSRIPQNTTNTATAYPNPWGQLVANQYPPYWNFPPFPPPGFGGTSPPYPITATMGNHPHSTSNPWNFGFPHRPPGGFQPSPSAFHPPPNFNPSPNFNPPPNFPGGYAPNWPNLPPAPANYSSGPPGGGGPPGPPGHGPSGPPGDEPPRRGPTDRESPRNNSFARGDTGNNNQPSYPQRSHAEKERFELEKQLINKESKIEIRKPEPFTGTDTKDYVSECLTMFQAKPTTYALERDQVLFAASWLKDNALRHWTALLRNNPDHPALHQWGAYIKEFTSIFGPHNAARDAEIALVKLKMFDNNRFSNFLVRFEAEAFETGWDYQAIAFHLRTSIAPRLREGLRNVAPATSYAELKGALMQIDTQYWEAEAERTLYARPANKPFSTTNTAQRTTPTDKPSTATFPNAARGPLTQEERDERRKNGLCMGCGKKDHIVRDCPLRKVTGRATYTIDGEEIIEDYYEVEEENEQEND
jgi:hypothetical protein